jgi:hypothetical protein
MNDDVIWQRERRSDQAEGHGWIQNDEIRAERLRQRIHSPHHPGMWKENRLLRAMDFEWLTAIELVGPFVWRGQYRKGITRQPPPPFPQQGLDTADLGGKVVRDKKMFHRRPVSLLS